MLHAGWLDRLRMLFPKIHSVAPPGGRVGPSDGQQAEGLGSYLLMSLHAFSEHRTVAPLRKSQAPLHTRPQPASAPPIEESMY